jgi:hypothetical protein
MTAANPSRPSIDAKLQHWQQGDVILNAPLAFIHYANLAEPVSPEAKAKASALSASADPLPQSTVLESDVKGFVVLTQTCDIVRSAEQRPYVEIAPLVEVSVEYLEAVRDLRRSAFVYIPGLVEKRLVGGLDRVMTIEKSVLVALPREPGLHTDADIRAFGRALARKRSRFAFPNSFVDFVRPLQKRMVARYGKTSEEGQHASALREIRVTASPSWRAAPSDIFFWFIKQREPDTPQWPKWQQQWLGLMTPTDTYQHIDGVVAHLEDITALDYTTSEHLDLDQLSGGEDDSQ